MLESVVQEVLRRFAPVPAVCAHDVAEVRLRVLVAVRGRGEIEMNAASQREQAENEKDFSRVEVQSLMFEA